MRLYFLRHGIAEDARIDLSDAERRLTKEGIAEIEAEARVFTKMKMKLGIILTSPLPRASETAEIVAKALGIPSLVKVETRLAFGASLQDIRQMVSNHAALQNIMFVGHEPTLSSLAGQLVGGAAIALKKGGLIRINIDEVRPGAGVLEWVLTPAILLR